MLIVRDIKIPLDADFNNLEKLFLNETKIDLKYISKITLHKRSIDARKKDKIHFNCAFIVETTNDKKVINEYKKINISNYKEKTYEYPAIKSDARPVIVGFGPSGIFAALILAKAGLRPIVIEQGKDVEGRKKDVDEFFKSNKLNISSNIQFGEGGAGTFSDGKLNTGVNDYRIKEVLKVFASHGANENILFDAKPHIGTDVLIKVVKSIREEIIKLGGQVLFQHKLVGIKTNNNKLKEIEVQSKENTIKISCNYLVLAIGHSARDTYEMLSENAIIMQPKDFAIGVRIEHKQEEVNKAQYKEFYDHPSLGAADYKLSCHLENGRSVFTFCMCPGGYVINASSENGGIAINGMSNMKRDGINANSAVLVNVKVDDYYKNSVLDGIYFQRMIEQSTYSEGKGYPICQKFVDFKQNKPSQSFTQIIPTVKPDFTKGDINNVLPEFICESLKEGIAEFGKKISGFDCDDAVITASETRSSSPVRISRDEFGLSNIGGIFPCGEGAGYAGGIMSAAIDGMKIAEKVIEQIKRNEEDS